MVSYDLLLAKLGMLSETATKILGYCVIADICGGNEIEFRKMNNNGIPDDFSTIRIEEILKSVWIGLKSKFYLYIFNLGNKKNQIFPRFFFLIQNFLVFLYRKE